MIKYEHKAFTLAEVLITLGIIGIVAAMTLPTLINNHNKKVTITRLKHFQSLMSQAFNQSTVENGDFSGWDSPPLNDGNKMMEWAEKYYLPYIQTTEKYVSGKYVVIGLKNGSGFTNYGQHYFFCVKFKDCKDVLEIFNPRDRFIFAFQVERNLSWNAESTTFRPYTCDWDGTRENLIDGRHKCKRNGGYGHCAKLIEFDGWKISDDYPW